MFPSTAKSKTDNAVEDFTEKKLLEKTTDEEGNPKEMSEYESILAERESIEETIAILSNVSSDENAKFFGTKCDVRFPDTCKNFAEDVSSQTEKFLEDVEEQREEFIEKMIEVNPELEYWLD